MQKDIGKEIAETMAIISAILDILKLDVDNMALNIGYYSPNANRLNSLILESKRGINNIKTLMEKNKMEFDAKNETVNQKPASAQTQAPTNPEESSAAPEQPNEPPTDEFGISLNIDNEVRAELQKVLFALNNVATYAMDQITVSNRVFARRIAQIYQVPEKVIFDEIDNESKMLQKMREREANISDANIKETNNGAAR